MLDKVKTAVKAFLSVKWSKKSFVQDVYIPSVVFFGGGIFVFVCTFSFICMTTQLS